MFTNAIPVAERHALVDLRQKDDSDTMRRLAHTIRYTIRERKNTVDFIVKAEIHFTVPDNTDPDEFHDKLRDIIEDLDGWDTDLPEGVSMDWVRDLEVEKLENE